MKPHMIFDLAYPMSHSKTQHNAREVKAGQRWLLLLWLMLGPALAQAAGPYDKGLLFRIEHAGQAPSHIFGTMHSDDTQVVTLPAPVRQAFDAAEAVVLEVELDAANALASMAALVLSDGRDLNSMIGAELYAQTIQAMAERGVPEVAIQRYKPWAVAIMLSMPPSNSGQYLDSVLYQAALLQGKTVRGLETAEEQLAVFDTLTEQDQITLLREALENRQHLPKLFEELKAAYLQRDLDGLVKLSDDYELAADSPLSRELDERLIDRRNHIMVERMRHLLAEGNAFIAVGALHLPGEKGILALLEARGFKIQPVY